MSQYCDPSDFVAPGVSDPEKLTACVRASGLADSYLAKRLVLPLVSWGDDLRSMVSDIARWRALKDRGFDPSNVGDGTIIQAKKDAMAWLALVSTGEVELVGATDSSPTVEEASPLVESDTPAGWQWSTEPSEEDE